MARTQEELDESFRQSYWSNAIRYGLQYFVAGRYAVAAGLTPVSANLLHHAVEMLLKGCLSYNDSADEIRHYGRRESYGHGLMTLWAEFKRRNVDLELAAYNVIVAELHKFEHIRYPERLVSEGGTISIGWAEVDQPLGDRTGAPNVYVLMLPQIDRLVALLFRRSNMNPDAIHIEFGRDHCTTYHLFNNQTPLWL